MRNIPIFLSSDNNYAPFVATTIASICDNTKAFCDFYILDGGISRKNKENIKKLKMRFKNFSIEFLSINQEVEFKNIEYKNFSKYISISTYNRFLIPRLKPKLDKILYLDVDIIVKNDISELYNTDLKDYLLAAVPENITSSLDRLRYTRDLNLSIEHKYFNAGVLLINNRQWLIQDVLKDVFNTEHRYRNKLKLADQDILNIIFNNNYKELSAKYNVLNEDVYCEAPYKELCSCIRHFNGPLKPWAINEKYSKKSYMVRHISEFCKYAQMTSFYNELLDKCNDPKQQEEIIRKLHLEFMVHKRVLALTENRAKRKDLQEVAHKIPIFLSSDNNYAPFVATTIASVCDNTKSFCDFYILDGGISEENQEKICSLKKQFGNFSIEFIKIDLEKEFCSIDYKNECSYVSMSTYNRFLIPLLKQEINKAIYLDVDVIVAGDINEFYKQPLNGHLIGAIPDLCRNYEFLNNVKEWVGLKLDSKYFNAGVLLIDCQKWRENDITNKLFDVEKKYREKLRMADQDVLNIYFENDYEMFNEMFNEQDASGDFIIRHFSGSIKPWQADFYIHSKTKRPCKTANLDLFWKYAKITSFYEQICCIKEQYLTSNLLYKRFNAVVNKGVIK